MREPLPQSDDQQRQLREAFDLFNQLSQRLEQAYAELEIRAADLEAELRSARHERESMRARKERLAMQLSGLLAELPIGVLLLDRSGQIEEANTAIYQLFNAPLVGESWEQLAAAHFDSTEESPDLISKTNQRFRVAHRNLANEAQLIVLTEVGESQTISNAAPLPAQSSTSTQENLAELGELAVGMAHQIRTPINTALLYASQLQTSDDPATARCADKLVFSLDHLNEALNGLLTHTRVHLTHTSVSAIPDMGKIAIADDPTAVSVSLASLLFSAVELIGPAAKTKIQLDESIQQATAEVVTNPTAFAGAVGNLLQNALDAGATKVDVDLSVTGSSEIEVAIKDNGSGIGLAKLENIFQPFYSATDNGTGLGLAIATAVFERIGGSLAVTQTNPKGTTMTIRLPQDPIQDSGRSCAS